MNENVPELEVYMDLILEEPIVQKSRTNDITEIHLETHSSNSHQG